jgi:Mg-chelatase subunit ChlD
MKIKSLDNKRGVVLVVFAIVLVALIGFIALGTEVGGWYLVRTELSKSVDAAALTGAKNISNPYVNPATLANEIGYENFPAGILGTPGSGQGAVTFSSTVVGNDKVQVSGTVNSRAIIARLFGVNQIENDGAGVAQKKEVEIMLVLDRSGSMGGSPIADLKEAALSFVSYFEDTQDKDKMGLISFASGVTVNYALSTNFVTEITHQISSHLSATGATNAEDAVDQSDGPSGFTDQSGIPGDRRVQQFMIFFSDGNPTAFRGTFRRNATDYDAVAMGTGQTCDSVYNYMGYPNSENLYSTSTLVPTPTGDGNRISGSPLTTCTYGGSRYLNTRWYIFSDATYGISNPTSCRRTTSQLSFLAHYICSTARAMAKAHAQELKDEGVKIYTIGLGDIDQDFLGDIASGAGYEYYTPDSGDLQALFNAVAKEIKLRLVE